MPNHDFPTYTAWCDTCDCNLETDTTLSRALDVAEFHLKIATGHELTIIPNPRKKLV